MKNFLSYLTEANSIGAAFEQKTVKYINNWLRHIGLDNNFKAERYQTLQNNNVKCEKYSDIVIKNLSEEQLFFIECKEYKRSNILNIKFNISSNGDLLPIVENENDNNIELYQDLIQALKQSTGFKSFIKFLNSNCLLLNNKKPIDFWNNKINDDKMLKSLISIYNKGIKSDKFEADCKKFDIKKIRESTKNILICALAWRLSDIDRTWDICTVQGDYNFGKLIRNHYLKNKKIPAEYIQIGDDILFSISEKNPFNIKNITKFPDNIECKFTLKFTPRFGTGSIYITPRSEITSDFSSNLSFINKKKWPTI